MELLREIAFRGRTEDRNIEEIKVGDLTIEGRVEGISQRGHVTILKFRGADQWLAAQAGSKVEVII